MLEKISEARRKIGQRLGDSNEFEPLHIDTETYSELQSTLPDGQLLRIRPKKDCAGLQAAREFAESFYSDPDELPKGESPEKHTFEIWYDDSKVQFFYRPESVEWKNAFIHMVRDKYPGTRVSEQAKMFPDFAPGDFVCGGSFEKENTAERPLKMVDNIQSGGHSFSRDPFGSVTSDMVVQEDYLDIGQRVNSDESRSVLQITFQPATRQWSKGGSLFWNDVEDFADTMKKPRMKGGFLTQFAREFTNQGIEMREPSQKVKKAAQAVTKLRGQPGYYFEIRLLSISPYKRYAKVQARQVAEQVAEAYRNGITEQRLKMDPKQGDELQGLVFSTAERKLDVSLRQKLSQATNIISASELGGLVHIPNEEIETPNVDWTRKEPGAGVPADAVQMEDVLEGETVEETGDEREYIFDPKNPEMGGATVSEQREYQRQSGDNETNEIGEESPEPEEDGSNDESVPFPFEEDESNESE